MNTSLYRIVYCSRNLIAGTDAQQDQVLAGILQTARTNNAQQNVTGALLYNSGHFAQVLEGSRDAIERIFERIQRDQRHDDVTVLEFTESAARDFPEWSMAHVQPVTDWATATTGNTLLRAMADPDASGHDVLELLRSLVTQDA